MLVFPLVSACFSGRSEFFYLYITDPEPVSMEEGRPPTLRGYRGPAIPLRYSFQSPGGNFEVRLGREHYVPSIRILASEPITRIDAGRCASVSGESTTDVAVDWDMNCVHVGDTLHISFSLGKSAEDLRLAGVIRQAGTFAHTDFF